MSGSSLSSALGRAALLFALGMFPCANCLAEVVVQTSDGRTLRGEVDSQTDEQSLWLRRDTETISLASHVSWDAVAAATIDGERIDVEHFAELAEELAVSPRENLLVEQGPLLAHYTEPVPRPTTTRITNIEIDARLANFDRTVEPDGFEIVLAAVDVYGHEVPVRGSLYVQLHGERNVHHTGRIRFENLHQWTQPVEPEDFVDGLAMYMLPYRRLSPEFDDELRPDAQLNARLGVFGQGNFSATIPVPLWNFSPFRDRLQMFEGSRFFRNELTHRPRQHSDDPPGIYRRWFRNY